MAFKRCRIHPTLVLARHLYLPGNPFYCWACEEMYDLQDEVAYLYWVIEDKDNELYGLKEELETQRLEIEDLKYEAMEE